LIQKIGFIYSENSFPRSPSIERSGNVGFMTYRLRRQTTLLHF